MKTNSTLITYLIATSALVGCASNKSIALDSPGKTGENLQVVATKVSDLVKADSAEGYHQIAKRYKQNGNAEMAIIAYQKSLILDQNYTKSLAGLAAIYANQELYFLAIPLLEKAVAVEPNAINFNNLGYVYYLVKQYQEASRVLNQAIALDSNYAQAKSNLALVTNILTDPNSVFLIEESKEVANAYIAFEQPIDKMTQNQISVVRGKNEAVQPLSNQTQLTQTAEGIYQLNLQTNSEALVKPANNTNQNYTQNNTQLQVAMSGGIIFKHNTVISKLFDVASTTLTGFKLSDTGKYLEVINGNGTKGIAGAVASKLKENGIEYTKIANAKKFNYIKTYIEYRIGYRNDAVNLNHSLLNKPFLIRNDRLSADTAIRLVLGKDLLINNI